MAEFTGNSSLLVTTNVFQDLLVDKTTGEPLAAGIVTCYEDSARTILKRWYYYTGQPGAPSWADLDNPLTLSAVGSVQDPNGNDVLPFFYPVNESNTSQSQPYYITIDNSQGTRQFTRQNFPFVASAGSSSSVVSDNNNLIINSEFWRNIGSINSFGNVTVVNGANVSFGYICPSQHSGYVLSDMAFYKTTGGSSAPTDTDVITFSKFASSSTPTLTDNITPEFYMNVACSASGTATSKYILIPLQLHLDALSNAVGVFTIQAQAASVSSNNTILVSLYTYNGAGQTVPTPVTSLTINTTTSWEKYTVNIPFPNAENITTGVTGDDAYYIRLDFTTGGTFSLNIAMPQFFLGNLGSNIPTTAFRNYDQNGCIIESARTGDIRTSTNSWTPFGWAICNDGIISNSATAAGGSITLPAGIGSSRANVDAWPLFNLLWTLYKPIDTGSNLNQIAQMYDSTGAATNYGATAVADWNAGKQMQLNRTQGRALTAGFFTAGGSPVTYDRATTPSWSSAAGVFTIVSTGTYMTGMPVSLTGTMPAGGPFVTTAIYYIILAIDGSSTTTFQLASSYANAIAGTAIGAGSSSTNGSGLAVNVYPGSWFGEARHTLLAQEMANPTVYSGNASFPALCYFPTGGAIQGAALQSGVTTTFFGSGSTSLLGAKDYPFNITQQSAFFNVFYKL